MDAGAVVRRLLEEQDLHVSRANGGQAVAVEFADAEHREAKLLVIEQQRLIDAIDIQYEVSEEAFHLAINFLDALRDSFKII